MTLQRPTLWHALAAVIAVIFFATNIFAPKGTPVTTGIPLSASPPAAADKTIRIASWNIEWLGKPDDRSGPAKNIAQKPDDLAAVIIASDAAIIAVEEIVTRVPGKPIRSPELESVIASIKTRTHADWDYVLFPGRADGDQLTGLLWDKSRATALSNAGKPWVQGTDSPWMLPIPKSRSAQNSPLWNRPPHAMKFSFGQGLTDIVVIVLHMKADYNGDFAAHRREEADALVRELNGVRSRFTDQDVILLGDTNCTGDHEPAIAAFEAAGFKDLNAAHLQTHWRGGAMDRVLTPSAQPEFRASTFEVLGDAYLRKSGMTPQDYKKRCSDHYLVTATIAVTRDDD